MLKKKKKSFHTNGVSDHQAGGRLAQTGRKGSIMFFSPSFLFLPARGKIKAEGVVWTPRQGQEVVYFGDLPGVLQG